MKRNQSKIFFLMSYNSSSFDDMKFLTYGVPRRDVVSANMVSQFWCFEQLLMLTALLLWPVSIRHSFFFDLIVIYLFSLSRSFFCLKGFESLMRERFS